MKVARVVVASLLGSRLAPIMSRRSLGALLLLVGGTVAPGCRSAPDPAEAPASSTTAASAPTCEQVAVHLATVFEEPDDTRRAEMARACVAMSWSEDVRACMLAGRSIGDVTDCYQATGWRPAKAERQTIDPRLAAALLEGAWDARPRVGVAARTVPHAAPGTRWADWSNPYADGAVWSAPILAEETGWLLIGDEADESRVGVWIADDRIVPVVTRLVPIVPDGGKPPAAGGPGAFALRGHVPAGVPEAGRHRVTGSETVVIDGWILADAVGLRYEPGDDGITGECTYGAVHGRVLDRKGGREIATVDGLVCQRAAGKNTVEIFTGMLLLRGYFEATGDEEEELEGGVEGGIVGGVESEPPPPPREIPPGTCLVVGGHAVGVARAGLLTDRTRQYTLSFGHLPFAPLVDPVTGTFQECAQLDER
jgi:hypothetical protein